MQRRCLFYTIIIMPLMCLAQVSYAGMSSASYSIPTGVIAGGGVQTGSANYVANSTLGQPSPLMDSDNNPQSPGYDLYPGFLYSTELAAIVIYLKNGFNLIAIPVDVSTQPDLRDWLPLLGDSSEIEKIMAYDKIAKNFVTLVPGASNQGFNLQGGEALIVYSLKQKSIRFETASCVVHDLTQNANLIGIACPPAGYSAFRILDELGIERVTSIQRYSTKEGKFDTAGFDANGNTVGVNFPIIPAEGYIIFMKQAVSDFFPSGE